MLGRVLPCAARQGRLGIAAAVAVALSLCGGGCGKSSDHARDAGAPVDLAAAADGSLLGPECDVLTNGGCPAGQRCTIGSEAGRPRDLCVALVADPKPEGFACVPVVQGDRIGDDCDAGLVCMTLVGATTVCRRPCYQRADCKSGEGCTVPTLTSTSRSDDGGTFVLRGCNSDVGCDPILQNVCLFGLGCYLSTFDDVGRISECLQPGVGQAGSACTAITDCAPGFRCDGLGICRRYCYDAGPQQTDGGVAGGCPDGEGLCDDFTSSGGKFGVCGAQ